MRIVITKEIENEDDYVTEWRKIYNKTTAIEVVQNILKEYEQIFGKQHEDADKLENFIKGAYDVDFGDFGDFYYVITIIPKRYKLPSNDFNLASLSAFATVGVLYDSMVGVNRIGKNEIPQLGSCEFEIIDRNNQVLDTFSIHVYENNEFYLEFDWKNI